MKLSVTKNVLSIFFFLGFCQIGLAQERSLTKILNEFSKKYKVHFSYDSNEISSTLCEFEFKSKEKISVALERLLTPHKITYELVGKKFYVLSIENKQKNNNSPTKGKSQIFFSTLLDQQTNEPIYNAFIFIKNSSIGTTSDFSGKFELDIGHLKNVELVITHLTYKTKSILLNDLKQLDHIIPLEKKSLDINEVVIKTKKANLKKRKQWMKKFELAFLGKRTKRNKIQILNPKVLWFEEKNNTLTAHATDNIILLNKPLGYRMKIFLKSFSLDNNDDVIFSGKVFFEDILAKLPRKKKRKKNRAKAYLSSKRHFFKSLLNKNVAQRKYEFGVAKVIPNTDSLNYQQLDYEQLNTIKKFGNTSLFMDGYFVVRHKNVVGYIGTSTAIVTPVATSFLKLNTGKIILDQNGIILNPSEIEESGHWTKQRIAKLLPIDYQYIASFSSINIFDKIIDSLFVENTKRPQEKIYLHLNKPYYSINDELWFKAYLVNANNHSQHSPSKVIYIDLISPNGKITNSWILHKDKIMHGDFQLNKTHEAGQYQLRAYTQNMRNIGKEYFYNKTITVYDYSKNEQVQANETIKNNYSNNINTSTSFSLNFYPEGGDLLNGLSSNIAFKAVDTLGNPLKIEGLILDQNENIVSKIKTAHEGIGLFNLTPTKADRYKAIVNYQHTSFEFPLPEALAKGMVLRVNAKEENHFFIKILSNNQKELKGAFLIGHVRGQVVCLVDDLQHNQIIKIPKETIPSGIIHFTVFNNNGLPESERLVFNDWKIDSSLLNIEQKINPNIPSQAIQVEINLNNNYNQATPNLSVSITDQSMIHYPKYDTNIRNYLLLNSDLKTNISNPEFYLSKINQEKRFFLDLILMTKGWRRFNWKDLLNLQKKPLAFLPETGYSIKGYTTKKGEEERIQSVIMFSSLEKNMIYKNEKTDQEGNFSFNNLPALDSITYILQGRVFKKNENFVNAEKIKLSGNRLIDFHFTKQSKPKIELAKKRKTMLPKSNALHQFLAIEKEEHKDDPIYSQEDWQIDLDEVKVTATKRFTSPLSSKRYRVFYLDNMDWIPAKHTGKNLLSSLTPQNNYIMGAEGKLNFITRNRRGEILRAPVSISIDGLGANPRGSNALPFFALTADRIKTIVIAGTGIFVTTRRIPRSLEIYLKSGILHFKHPGYSKARSFYTTPYLKQNTSLDKKDYRSAIYWNPKVSFDQNGKTKISFFPKKNHSTYELRIEGLGKNGEIYYERFLINNKTAKLFKNKNSKSK